MGWEVAGALVLVVRIVDASGVESELMERSLGRAAEVLRAAGIDVNWRRCTAGADERLCGTAPAANEVVARLLTGVPPLGATACGAALVPALGSGHFLSLFTDCVRVAASEVRVAEDVVFGYTLAHEIGHLLLGLKGHGPVGLMQARPRPIDWTRASHGALRFTSKEVLRLRAALERRIAQLPRDSR